MSGLEIVQKKLFLEVATDEGIDVSVLRSCLAANIATVSRYLCVNPGCSGETLTAAGLAAIMAATALPLNAANESEVIRLHSAAYAAKSRHSGLKAAMTSGTKDAKEFTKITDKKVGDKQSAALRVSYLLRQFQTEHPDEVVDAEKIFEDKVISDWALCLMNNTTLKPKPDSSKVFTSLESTLDENETDMGGGLFYRGDRSRWRAMVRRRLLSITRPCIVLSNWNERP